MRSVGPTHAFKVLYLFSGTSRTSSFGNALRKVAERHELQIEITEVDILRDPQQDLSQTKVAAAWIEKIQAGHFDAVLVTPPCSTFTRARCANKRGPPPIRTKQHPFGFPWLSNHLRQQAELGNRFADFMVACYQAAAVAKRALNKLVLMFSEHPEDLGRVVREEDGLELDPASIWQLEKVQQLLLLELGLFTVGFNQCCFGTPYRKPTRVISNLPGIRSWGAEGWPQFDVDNQYLGPIVKCGCNISVSLAKKRNSEGFRTTGTSAYPAAMDAALAQAVAEALRTALSPPTEGGTREKSAAERSGAEKTPDGLETKLTPEEERKSSGGVSLEEEAAGGSKAPVAVSQDDEGIEPMMEEIMGKPVGNAAGNEGSPRGHPILAYYKGKHRMIHDGGGLGSPGRWPVCCRSELKSKEGLAIMSVVRREFLKWLLTCQDGGKQAFWKLASGRAKESPFLGSIEAAKKAVDEEVRKYGEDPGRKASDREVEINFRRLRSLAKLTGDEDFDFLTEMAATGVAIGVDETMPRVPAVFEEKLKWAREFTEEELRPIWADNYTSAEEGKKDIWRQVDEEVAKGTIIRMSEEDAKNKYGSRLAVAALGAVPKELNSEKVRLIHDGSYSVDVNKRIRVLDRMRFPLVDDAAALLLEAKVETEKLGGAPRATLVYDVKGAHKLVPIKESDWGLQAFRLPGERHNEGVYLHTRGTFGIASAAYHWQRVAAVVIRLAHRLGGRDLGLLHLLFADDGWMVSVGKHYWRPLLFWLFVLDIVELPLSWSKVGGGTKVQWIGYDLSVEDFTKGISQRKVRWVADWITKHLASRGVTGREMKSALGRLVFVAGALQHVRPFLGPLFAWASVLRGGTFSKMPDAVAILLTYVRKQIEGDPMVKVRAVSKQRVEAFRIDAKAEGEKIVIGGWESMGRQDTRGTRWFSMELDRKSAPWAFVKGEPFRSIASLELTAVLVAVKLFCSEKNWRGARAVLTLTAYTDNVSNTYVLKKYMSSKFPLSVILLELAAQLKSAGLELDLGWVPRDQNVPADSLTNELFDGFDESKRIKVNFSDLEWIVMDELMEKAAELDSEVKLAKTSKEAKSFGGKDTKAKKGETKWKDPW